MANFRILIADDQVSDNTVIYEHLLETAVDENLRIEKSTPRTFERFRNVLNQGFDAILLDVNLDDWGVTLNDAFSAIGAVTQSPVVLVSQRWGDTKTHGRVVEAMAAAKKVRIAGTLGLSHLSEESWQDYAKQMRDQLRLAIAANRRQSQLDLGENTKIHILHLSDPQYGDANTDHWSFLAENEIAKFVGIKLQKEIHILAITGDITYSGRPSEFVDAKERLSILAEAFLPSREDWRESLLLVPGNHDVNLRLAAAEVVSFNFSESIVEIADERETDLRRFSLQPFRDFAWGLTGDSRWRDARDLSWINDSFRHLGLRLHLLNSVSTLDCRMPTLSEVPTDALAEMTNQAKPATSEKLFSVAFSHHGRHLPEYPDVEGVKNWPDLAKYMQVADIKLWLHGHGHKREPVRCPWDNTDQVRAERGGAQGQLEPQEVLRVMAPTTHLNQELRPPKEYRGFNLITLKPEVL